MENVEEKIKSIIDELKPFLISDGGALEYIKFEDGIVYVKLGGACADCVFLDVTLKDGIEYVTRYCGRTPICENRIINYDGKNVTFSYNDHYDESYHEIAVSAEEFIFSFGWYMLVRHEFMNFPSFSRQDKSSWSFIIFAEKIVHSLQKA